MILNMLFKDTCCSGLFLCQGSVPKGNEERERDSREEKNESCASLREWRPCEAYGEGN